MISKVKMIASFIQSKRMLMYVNWSGRAYLDINQLINGQDATQPLLWGWTAHAPKSHHQEEPS